MSCEDVREEDLEDTQEEEELDDTQESSQGEDQPDVINVAIVGCAHGELDIIYETLRQKERDNQIKIDLLLCCGDFQAMRNDGDLVHFHCPDKYKRLCDFHKYYSGEVEAPYLTVFVGGNHESPAFSMELPHGGWVASNIYYMGFASVVNFGGLRIGGWSGIFKQQDYMKSHHEAPPFERGQQISAYHVRAIEKFRLELLENKDLNCLDVFMTHDWPVGITKFGNEAQLLRYKKYFANDIKNNCLGNPHSRQLLPKIRPRHWFAGHLHCKFEANVVHEENGGTTEFLALHKCVHEEKWRNQMFHDIRTIKADSPLSKELRYDPKWLAILKKTSFLENASRSWPQIPSDSKEFLVTEEDLKQVGSLFNDDCIIPLNFRQTATPQPAWRHDPKVYGAHYYRNPQTKEFCERLQIPDLNEQLCIGNMGIVGDPYYLQNQQTENEKDEGEITLDVGDLFGDDDFIEDTTPLPSRKRPADDTGTPDVEEKRPRLEEEKRRKRPSGNTSNGDEKRPRLEEEKSRKRPADDVSCGDEKRSRLEEEKS